MLHLSLGGLDSDVCPRKIHTRTIDLLLVWPIWLEPRGSEKAPETPKVGRLEMRVGVLGLLLGFSPIVQTVIGCTRCTSVR